MSVETLIHLEKGKRIKPFEGKREFLPVDLVELINNQPPSIKQEPVLTAGIEFEGVEGQVLVIVSSRIDTQRAQTPLGPTNTHIEYDNRKVVVRQIPLHLGLTFSLHSFRDFQKLLDNKAVFELGEESYLVWYNNLQSSNVTVQDFEQSLYRVKTLPALGSLVFPQTYSPARVSLPYDIDRLSQGINLTMGKT